MSPIVVTFVIFFGAIGAGVFGSLLGLGGGIIAVPLLTTVVYTKTEDIHFAIGAAIVAVVATSTGGAVRYLRDNVANLRLGMYLEIGTCIGAVAGALLAGFISGKYLYIIFGVVLLYSCLTLLRRTLKKQPVDDVQPHAIDPLADKLNLHGSYYDPAEKKQVTYRVRGSKPALAIATLAGVNSGLLGVGGGIVKVPMMNVLMGVPMKASTATSNFMIGVTAAAGATVYFMRGEVDPFVAGPLAAGVLCGAQLGAKVFGRLRGDTLTRAFIIVLFIIGCRMIWRGLA